MPVTTDSPTMVQASSGSWPVDLRTVVGLVGVIALMALLVLRATRPLYDPDLWWHLRAGEGYLFEGWSLTSPPPLTPFATSTWFSHSWLPEIAVAKFEQWFGLPGVAWIYGAGLVTLVVVVYAILRRHAVPLGAALVTVLAIAGSAGSLTPRPQLLSYILLAVTVDAWLKAANDLAPPWWLIPMTWIWSMSHGMWLVGVVLGSGVVVGLMLDRRLDRRTASRLAAVPIGSFVAAGLTPQGPRNLWAVTETSDWFPFISEYAAPALPDPLYMISLGLVALVVIVGLRSAESVSWAHLAILLQAALWMIYTVRSIAWGAIIVAPLAAASLQSLLPDRGPRGMGRVEMAILGGAAAIGLGLLAYVAPLTATEPGIVPIELNDELGSIEDGTAILNQYALGGWIEWEHRHLAPVIDGNTNGYVFEDIVGYTNAMKVGPGWEDYVAEKGVTYALLEENSPLAVALAERRGWRVLGSDSSYQLLKAP